jgi:tRNA-splicing ligase RtcB
VVEQGARWCVDHGYGWEEDLELIEESGCIEGADSAKISDEAVDRGYKQIGTLGSGNHYLEIQVARREHIMDEELARRFGITIPDQIVVMFHCGSRGFGHQVATDYLQIFLKVMQNKYGIKILDRELACAPFDSPEGRDYFAAMKCAINMSFANRQVIVHRIREVFSDVFGRSSEDLEMDTVHDVAHNTAKLERHTVEGHTRTLLVHRKGATRAFGPHREGVPERYREVGQPWRGEKLQREMEGRGIYVRTASWAGLAEEAGGAYKDIDDVVEATEQAGISKRVVRFMPIGNVKG